MSTIGKAVLKLETESAAFTKGIRESVESTHELSESVESIKGMMEGAFAFVGIEASIGGIKEMVGHTMEATAQTERLSGSLGITTQSLQQLQTAGLLGAGVQADEFNGIMQKLTKSLGGAEEDGGKAADVLDKLHLGGDALKGAHIDEAFIKIAEEISKVPDPTARAKDEIALFGKQGQALDPLLSEGAEGIAKFAEEARKMGTAMSDTDAAKIMAANEAYEHMQLAITGVENELTVALAPVLEEILNKVLSIVPAADQMESGVVSALKFTAEGVGYVIDAWNLLKLAGEAVAAGLVGGLELVIMGVNKLAEGIAWVANKLGADWHVPEWMNSVQTTVDAWRVQVTADANATADQLKSPNSEKWGKFFDDIQNHAQQAAQQMVDKKHSIGGAISGDIEENAKKIDGILAGLKQQIDTFGMTESDKKLFDLKNAGADAAEIAKGKALADQLDTLNKQRAVSTELAALAKEAAQFGMSESQKKLDDLQAKGASADQIKQAEGLNKQIEAMQAWKKEQEDANKLIADSMSPLDKYQSKLDEVQKLFKDGLITAAQQSDAIAKAQADLDKADKKEDPNENKAVAAITRRFDFNLPTDRHPEINAQQLQTAKETLDESKKQTDCLTNMRNFARNADQASDEIIDFTP